MVFVPPVVGQNICIGMANNMVWRFLVYFGKALLCCFPLVQGQTDAETKAEEDQKEMIIGLAAGLGFFVGLILLICFVWCCCCVSKDETTKIVPSSVASSKASSARTRATSRVVSSRS